MLEEVMTKIEDLDTKKKVAEALDIVKQEVLFVKKSLSIFKIEERQDK